MIAANKQNLLLLKSQKKLVQNGHKLLKEKRSGLIVTFLDLSKKGKELEKKISSEIKKALEIYSQSITFTDTLSLLNLLEAIPALKLNTQKKRISGVYVQNLNLQVKPPTRNKIKVGITKGLNNFAKYLPILLELIQLKLNCQKIAEEITKTNRQISNLEKKIENIEDDIKFINSALQEKQNLEKATLIKIFN
jgi:H(+)-transporting ATP synthase subunit D